MTNLKAGRTTAAIVALGTAGVAEAAGAGGGVSAAGWMSTLGVLAVVGVVVWVFNRVT